MKINIKLSGMILAFLLFGRFVFAMEVSAVKEEKELDKIHLNCKEGTIQMYSLFKIDINELIGEFPKIPQTEISLFLGLIDSTEQAELLGIDKSLSEWQVVYNQLSIMSITDLNEFFEAFIKALIKFYFKSLSHYLKETFVKLKKEQRESFDELRSIFILPQSTLEQINLFGKEFLIEMDQLKVSCEQSSWESEAEFLELVRKKVTELLSKQTLKLNQLSDNFSSN